MPIYTGSSEDGSDMELAQGVYVNPDNENEWSSEMYPSQKRAIAQKQRVMDYMNARYCLDDVRDQILRKECSLSRSDRDYVMLHYD